jgi:hypothetical protein
LTTILPYKLFRNNWDPTYPYDYVYDFIYILTNPFHWILHIGNISGSLVFRKKIGLKSWQIGFLSFFNFLISALGFLLIHKITSNASSEAYTGTGMAIRYDVFEIKTKKPINIL